MRQLDGVGYSDDDRAFARELKATIPDERIEP